MNQQIPFFMPMYPSGIKEEINRLERRIDKLEEKIINLEKNKIIKLNHNKDKDYFKEGYML